MVTYEKEEYWPGVTVFSRSPLLFSFSFIEDKRETRKIPVLQRCFIVRSVTALNEEPTDFCTHVHSVTCIHTYVGRRLPYLLRPPNKPQTHTRFWIFVVEKDTLGNAVGDWRENSSE